MESGETQLNLLIDLFPGLPRSELVVRLSSCSNFDRLLEDLLAEQSGTQTQTKRSHELRMDALTSERELQFIFPDIDANEVKNALQRHGYDFKAAADELTLPSPQKELAEFCELSQEIIDSYVRKHKEDTVCALVEILATYTRQKKAWNSRVQDRKLESAYTPFYVYKKSSGEAVELDEYILHNKQLQKLNYAFMKKLLVFFHGNVFKVLEAAKRVVDANKESFTFDTTLGLESETFLAPKPKASDLLRAGPSNTAPQWNLHLPVKRGSDVPIKSTPRTNPGKFLSTNVDLHGMTVREAVVVAEEAVDSWWKEEMDHRQAEGFFHKYGQKSRFLKPLDLVTGRGLHSQGGPKIRGPVIKMLTRKGFQFEEEIGKVVVLGKKR